jgi:hypothetical protein
MPAGPFDDIDPSELPPPPPGLIRLAARRSAASVPDDRRRSLRHPLATDLLVRPVDADFVSCGPAFRAVATDLSTGGLCLFHTRHIPAGLLAVRLPAKGRKDTIVVLSVVRSSALGRYYVAAGPLVARLGFRRGEGGPLAPSPEKEKTADTDSPKLRVWLPR